MIPRVGVCLEFGPHIAVGCGEAMVAADGRCVCPACGAVCRGRFQGCSAVWDRGPQPVPLVSKAPVAAAKGGQEPRRPAHLRGDDHPPSARDGAAVASPPEHVAVTEMARSLEDAVAAVGRVEAGQEVQLRPLLVKIEAQLDDILAALRDNGRHRGRSTNGKGPDGLGL